MCAFVERVAVVAMVDEVDFQFVLVKDGVGWVGDVGKKKRVKYFNTH